VPLGVLDLLGDKSVQAGVIDVATKTVETPSQVAAVIEAVAEHIPLDRVFPSTNCGMVPLSRDVAVAKMNALGKGVRKVG
jgi:5-methyltetrahydropteroyltriglutamate--homocysteine methyltransferase